MGLFTGTPSDDEMKSKMAAIGAIDKLKSLPQFLSASDYDGGGILNALNGCIVRQKNYGLRLDFGDNDGSTRMDRRVIGEDNINRFVRAMELQAKSLVKEGGASEH